MKKVSTVLLIALVASVCICPPAKPNAAKNDCITHPGQVKEGCLPKQVSCDTKNCSWCQNDACMECLPGFFMDFKDQTCKACTSGCSSCSGPEQNKCSMPGLGHYLLPTGEVKSCGIEGCASCIPKPGKKIGQVTSKMLCTSCDQGFAPKHSTAKSSIPTLECKKCADSNCIDCSAHKNECSKCKAGFLLEEDKCVASKENKDCKVTDDAGKCLDCPKGQSYSTKAKGCVDCPANCISCKEANKCLIGCKPGNFYDKKEKTCEACKIPGCRSCMDSADHCEACIDGKYYDLLKKKCMPCHSSCSICSGPKDTDCVACVPGKMYQSIAWVGAPKKLIKEKEKNMQTLLGRSEKVDNYMQSNFHPFEEWKCVDKCVEHTSFDKKKFQNILPPSSPAQCPSITLLHDQAKKRKRGGYGYGYDSSPYGYNEDL